MNRTVTAIAFALFVVIPIVLGGCTVKRYRVMYEPGRDAFSNAKESYRAGQKVELYYDLIATDTDYSFYVDGEPANVSYADNKGYVISFTMPAHDVTVRVDWRNSMEWYGEPHTPEDGRGDDETDEPETALTLSIDGVSVPVTWEDNDSVRELLEIAEEEELTVRLGAYGGFEQVGPLGRKIARSDVRIQTGPGDVVLYSGNQIVVFYGSNTWEYTRLGHIDLSREELTALLAKDGITLTITVSDRV